MKIYVLYDQTVYYDCDEHVDDVVVGVFDSMELAKKFKEQLDKDYHYNEQSEDELTGYAGCTFIKEFTLNNLEYGEEVIKALKYDRDQYAKGYNDAIDDAINAINNYNASEECDFYDQFGCMICISILKDLEKEVK